MSRDLVGSRVDRYEVDAQLGQGGFGAVYRARHAVLGTEVALKVLWPDKADDPTNVERFVREARAVAAIGSPWIARVIDAGTTDDGVTFLALELLEGRDLDAELEERGRLPVDESIRIVCQVLEGLAAAHAQGIVHRDLKPANVFLTEGGDVKLLDFGISKILGAKSLTDRGVAVGTPRFMAPEQLSTGRVDARTDLYAVGAMLYLMLSGAATHEGSGFDLILRRVQGERPLPLGERADVPPALAAIVHRALETDPAARWPSAGSLRRALEAVADGRPIPRDDRHATAAPAVSPLSGPVPGGRMEAADARDARTAPMQSVPPPGRLVGAEDAPDAGTVRMQSARPPGSPSPPTGFETTAHAIPVTHIGPSSSLLPAAIPRTSAPHPSGIPARAPAPSRPASSPSRPGLARAAPVDRGPTWGWLGIAGLAVLLALGVGVLAVLAWRVSTRGPERRPRPVAVPPAVTPTVTPAVPGPAPLAPTPAPAPVPVPPAPTPVEPPATEAPPPDPEEVRFERLTTAGARRPVERHLEERREAFAACAIDRPVRAPVAFAIGPGSVLASPAPEPPSDDPEATRCVCEAFQRGLPPELPTFGGIAGTVVIRLPARP